MYRKIGLAILSALLTLLVVSIAGEVYLRSSFTTWKVSHALKYEPAIFSRHIIRPQKRTVKKLSNPDYQIGINKHGFRGEEFKQRKPDTQVRIMIYGGSQVFDPTGHILGWPDFAEKLFHKRGKTQVEIINAGVPGHASFDSMGRLFSYGHYFEPDYVVLDNAWNDLKYFHYREAPIRKIKVFRRHEHPLRYYQNSLDRFLGERSQFYTYLRTYLLWFLQKHFGFFGPEKSKRETIRVQKPTDQALKQYKLSVRTFVELANQINATPILLTQPRLISPNNTKGQRKRIDYFRVSLPPKSLPKAFRKTDRIINNIASETSAKLLDASKRMTGRGRFFVDHVHLTITGSKYLGALLARKLNKLIKKDASSNETSFQPIKKQSSNSDKSR